jgi:hypothetical protein
MPCQKSTNPENVALRPILPTRAGIDLYSRGLALAVLKYQISGRQL